VIRLAEPQDLPDVADGIVALRGETVWAHVVEDIDRDYVMGWLWGTLSKNAQHALFVADVDGEVVGFIGGELVTECFVPDKLMLTEWAWYVTPRYRGKRIGWELWQALTAWARARGAVAAVRTKALPVTDLTRPRPFEQRIWMSLEAGV
jgi:GNAT superfamily N-acetyltransferase